MSENNNNELGRKLGLGAVIALGVYGYYRSNWFFIIMYYVSATY